MGRLFLTTSSLAIIRAEYELTEQGLSLLNRSQYTQVYSTHLRTFSYVANYARYADRWSFQGSSIHNTFTYNSSDALFESRVDFVVTHRQAEGIKPFTNREQISFIKMPLQPFDKTQATFWDGENYLVPMRPLPRYLQDTLNRNQAYLYAVSLLILCLCGNAIQILLLRPTISGGLGKSELRVLTK